APFLRSRFNMSNFNYSQVLFVFLFAYGLFHPVMGRFIDWIGPRLGLAFSVIFWSVASMLHATARGVFSFGVFRFLLGVGAAGNFPGCVKIVAEQIPADLRALATGVFNVGAGLGAIIAPPLVAWLVMVYGWQAPFLATGGIGFLWVLVWLLFYRPGRFPAGAKAVGDASKSNDGTAALPWKALLGFRQVSGAPSGKMARTRLASI
ncbi:MAG: MFS transporter, partial [Acidobacteriia bacterium]|nr:MFS transporter [Terriglobia bacterium]